EVELTVGARAASTCGIGNLIQLCVLCVSHWTRPHVNSGGGSEFTKRSQHASPSKSTGSSARDNWAHSVNCRVGSHGTTEMELTAEREAWSAAMCTSTELPMAIRSRKPLGSVWVQGKPIW